MSAESAPYILAEGLGLDIPVYTHSQRTIRALPDLLLGAALVRPKRHLSTPLDDVSFEVKDGERLAVIGRNGAGKSTLLKVLVGAYPPTRGRLTVTGRPQALLNLALGFNQEASVRENILLRGIAMGMAPSRIHELTPEILEFAELEDAVGNRLRTLSSGQRMRLGFALATADQREILIMDEWIGTGDMEFVAKARERIRARVSAARIVVLASHNLKLLADVCSKGLLLDRGKVVDFGDVGNVISAYRALTKK